MGRGNGPRNRALRTRGGVIRNLFIRLFTPLARRLGGVSPDALTALSIGLGLLAGAAYALARRDPAWFLAGGALVALSGTADSLDGIVARLHGRVTRRGDFLDHFGDRLVNVAVLAGLAFAPGATSLLGLGVLIVVMLNSYLGTQIEASFGERHYGGPGKAEMFVGIVAASVLFALAPGAAFAPAGLRLSLVDLFFLLLGLLTLFGLGYRLRHALRLAREADAGNGGGKGDGGAGGESGR